MIFLATIGFLRYNHILHVHCIHKF